MQFRWFKNVGMEYSNKGYYCKIFLSNVKKTIIAFLLIFPFFLIFVVYKSSYSTPTLAYDYALIFPIVSEFLIHLKNVATNVEHI